MFRILVLILMVISFGTTAAAGEFVTLPAGEPACYSIEKIKTALEKNNLTIDDCGQIPNSIRVEVTDMGIFSAGGYEFQIKKFSFLQLLEDGTIEDAFLYGFLEIYPTIDQQTIAVTNED